jgi:hypothetical protein
MARRSTPLRYSEDPKDLTFVRVERVNGQRLRKLYFRLFGRRPLFKTPTTEPLAREQEFQAAIAPEIYRALLALQPEFHNPSGRPAGSKTKNRRKPPNDETKLSKVAKRQRKSRAKKARDNLL